MTIQIMHMIASSLQSPVIVILIVLAFAMVVVLGMVIAEVFTERRYFRLDLPALVDDMNEVDDPSEVIWNASMLRRQKMALLELLHHPDAKDAQRESMAVNLVAGEQRVYDNRVKVTDLIAKIAPMLGLMGTLIPLGPGIVGIGQGDTTILSQSLLVAFDTTVLGLIVGAIALFVSAIRKSWYKMYMAAFDAAMECVLEKANEMARSGTVAHELPVEIEDEPKRWMLPWRIGERVQEKAADTGDCSDDSEAEQISDTEADEADEAACAAIPEEEPAETGEIADGVISEAEEEDDFVFTHVPKHGGAVK